MADEEVMGSASPAPSDHKRKLDDLDSEPFEQPPVSAGSNGNSESVADGDSDAAPTGVSPEDPDVKRPRLDDKPDSVGLVETTENGHKEKREDEPKEDISESSAVVKNIELEEDQEKADEPLDAVNNESIADEANTNSIELQSAENPEESAKEEHQESEVEREDLDPIPDGARQEDVHGPKEQSTSADQPTTRRMEVPSNKVGVLIGKGGDTIRTLQYSSGARIQITRDADADPNSATRPVELIGSLDNINKAERLIKDVIAEADAGGSPSLVARGFNVNPSGTGEQIQIQVPNEKVGLIIGKGGENIKNLQTRSGARIQLIPQHLPEGDQSKERTVRVTGDRKQIEAAKEMIKEVMDQPVSARSSTPSSGNNNQQKFRPRGPPDSHWGGPRGGHGHGHHHHHHPSQPTGYNNYPPQRGAPYPSQNQPYPSYPPQQPPPKNNYGWDQRPSQGPPEHTGYDYYGGGQGPPPQQPPMHSHAPPPSYNYGPPQGPDYTQQQPPSYQHAAPAQGYGSHGYGEPKYDSQVAPPQQPTYPQSTAHYGQQDQYGKPLAYNAPQQGPYGQPYGQPRQQAYNYGSGPVQQGYPQYGTAPPVNDGYAASGGYGQQGGQAVSGYGQTGGQQAAPGSGYGQPGPAPAPTGGYGQYPSTQPGYSEQAPPNSAGYGYGAPPAADPGYVGGPPAAYGAPPAAQPAYSQPAPAPVPAQQGYDQTAPQAGGYVTPQPQAQAGYGQYDSSQMYAGHR